MTPPFFTVGPLKGRRILFGLLAGRERTDAVLAARLVPQAAAAAWNAAVKRDLGTQATLDLDRLEAGPELTGRREALAELAGLDPGHRVSELKRLAAAAREAVELEDLQGAVRQADRIVPHNDPAGGLDATLECRWSAGFTGPERKRIDAIAAARPSAFQSILAEEFRSRDRAEFNAWTKAVEQDQGLSW